MTQIDNACILQRASLYELARLASPAIAAFFASPPEARLAARQLRANWWAGLWAGTEGPTLRFVARASVVAWASPLAYPAYPATGNSLPQSNAGPTSNLSALKF